MAVFKTLLCSFVILIISNQIIAQQGGWQFPSFASFGSGGLGGFQLPSIPGLGGSSSSGQASPGFLAFPFNIPGLSGIIGSHSNASDNPISELSRQRREVDDEEEEESDSHNQNRLFFSAFPVLTSCNYTAQAGTSCPTCSSALRCLPNNLGLLTRCKGLFRHCNNGRCSLFQSSTCANSTTI